MPAAEPIVQPRFFDAPPPEPPADDLESALAALGHPRGSAGEAEAKTARAYLTEGRAGIRERHRSGASGRTVVRLHSMLMDRLLAWAWQQHAGSLEEVAVVAIGGYGRAELAPHSDVDLLFLHTPEPGAGSDAAPPPPVARAAEQVLYLLWDTGLEVGHAVRSPAACLEIAEEDHTARTALLDCRLVAGDAELYAAFERNILGEVHSRRVEAYIDQKVGEWRARHERFGQTVFRLEPDLKNGQGGLRDLQTALWVARAAYHVAGLSQLETRRLLRPREAHDAKAARDFLWRIRNALHYRAGRRQDHLTFDAQEALADELGYVRRDHELAVERLMRDYYLSARTVVRVSRMVLERSTIERRQAPFAPRTPPRRFPGGVRVWRERVTVEDPALFDREPLTLLRVFEVADREELPIYSFTRDLIREAAARIDDSFREREDVAATLRRLFEREGTRGAFLGPMHETGVLGALVPEFGRQTGLWQHDLYHTYTTDVHQLFAVRRLFHLRRGDLDDAHFAPEMRSLDNPYPLYLGAWFHDLGKGLGGGHSEKGAAMVRQIARRLRLSEEESGDLEFLVRAHLRMSHTSQRRDLSDPGLIESFAAEVGTRRRLRLLYLLTFADIGTTGENTWNDWKAVLLRELFEKTRAVLEAQARPESAPWDPAAGARAGAAALAEHLARHRSAEEIERFVRVLPDRYLGGVPVEKAGMHLTLLDRLESGAPLATRRVQHRAGGFTELILVTRDRPGLLADLTGAMAAHRVDILGAQIFSLSDGRVVDVFHVRDSEERLLRSGPSWDAVRAALGEAVVTPGLGARLVEERLRPSQLAARPLPPVPVQVEIDHDAADAYTVVDVFARDQLGLLHRITRTLHALGLSVHVARIATEAHRATDAFYVTEADGRTLSDPDRIETVRRALEAAAGGGAPTGRDADRPTEA